MKFATLITTALVVVATPVRIAATPSLRRGLEEVDVSILSVRVCVSVLACVCVCVCSSERHQNKSKKITGIASLRDVLSIFLNVASRS